MVESIYLHVRCPKCGREGLLDVCKSITMRKIVVRHIDKTCVIDLEDVEALKKIINNIVRLQRRVIESSLVRLM